jgi:hypothetical protein
MLLTVVGIILGLVGSYAFDTIDDDASFEVKPTDAITYVAVSFALILIALIACYIQRERQRG